MQSGGGWEHGGRGFRRATNFFCRGVGDLRETAACSPALEIMSSSIFQTPLEMTSLFGENLGLCTKIGLPAPTPKTGNVNIYQYICIDMCQIFAKYLYISGNNCECLLKQDPAPVTPIPSLTS